MMRRRILRKQKAALAFTFGVRRILIWLQARVGTSTPLEQSKSNFDFSFGNKTSSATLLWPNSTAPAKPLLLFRATIEPALLLGQLKTTKRRLRAIHIRRPATAKPAGGEQQSNPTKPLFSFGANRTNSSICQSPAPPSTTLRLREQRQ